MIWPQRPGHPESPQSARLWKASEIKLEEDRRAKLVLLGFLVSYGLDVITSHPTVVEASHLLKGDCDHGGSYYYEGGPHQLPRFRQLGDLQSQNKRSSTAMGLQVPVVWPPPGQL